MVYLSVTCDCLFIQEEKETESDLDPLSSTLSTSSISCSTKSINKLVLDRICAYVADSDKEFALCSIEGLTLLNGESRCQMLWAAEILVLFV